jgi:hypothetical protein
MKDKTIDLFAVIGDMMTAKEIGPDYWRAVSLLLLSLYQDVQFHSLVHLSLSIGSYAKSRGMDFDQVLEVLDPRAHEIWMQALAIAGDNEINMNTDK